MLVNLRRPGLPPRGSGGKRGKFKTRDESAIDHD